MLLTARHVLFPPNNAPNTAYPHDNTSASRRNVLLLGEGNFDGFLGSIKIRIGEYAMLAKHHQGQIVRLQAKVAGSDKDNE